jgi:16S rRNA (uracil1498-N3)-methyltransferase
MHRFFISPGAIQGDHVTIEGGPAHQIAHVLRLKPGAAITVLDDSGAEYAITLTAVDKRRAEGTITARREAQGEPPLTLTLYACLLKRDNFEWVLQKGTEIGVTMFVPVISARTVVDKARPGKIDRWARIISEAAEQSRRGRLPRLLEPLPFAEALAHAADHDAKLIPWEEAESGTLRGALPRGVRSVALCIGPEGGFSAGEIDAAHDHGFAPITLGPRILRAETAAVVAAALVIHELTG